jgi:hypothetical protein
MDVNLLSPELQASIKEIGTWNLTEIRTQVRALNLGSLGKVFALKEDIGQRDDAAIEAALDEALALIETAYSFEAYASWKMEGMRPLFLEHEMELLPSGKRVAKMTRLHDPSLISPLTAEQVAYMAGCEVNHIYVLCARRPPGIPHSRRGGTLTFSRSILRSGWNRSKSSDQEEVRNNQLVASRLGLSRSEQLCGSKPCVTASRPCYRF